MFCFFCCSISFISSMCVPCSLKIILIYVQIPFIPMKNHFTAWDIRDRGKCDYKLTHKFSRRRKIDKQVKNKISEQFPDCTTPHSVLLLARKNGFYIIRTFAFTTKNHFVDFTNCNRISVSINFVTCRLPFRSFQCLKFTILSEGACVLASVFRGWLFFHANFAFIFFSLQKVATNLVCYKRLPYASNRKVWFRFWNCKRNIQLDMYSLCGEWSKWSRSDFPLWSKSYINLYQPQSRQFLHNYLLSTSWFK